MTPFVNEHIAEDGSKTYDVLGKGETLSEDSCDFMIIEEGVTCCTLHFRAADGSYTFILPFDKKEHCIHAINYARSLQGKKKITIKK